jgi:hypothetical protein
VAERILLWQQLKGRVAAAGAVSAVGVIGVDIIIVAAEAVTVAAAGVRAGGEIVTITGINFRRSKWAMYPLSFALSTAEIVLVVSLTLVTNPPSLISMIN